MGNYIPCRIRDAKTGLVVVPRLRKRVADSYAERAGRVAAEALTRYRARYFAIRRDGGWAILPVSGPPSMPILEGLSVDAAEMWLMHRDKGA